MAGARASIPDIQRDEWVAKFRNEVESRKAALLGAWEAKWLELCDGKKLISDLHKRASLKMSESVFKVRIMKEMRETSSETWRFVRDMLKEFLNLN
jgi:hypothetical protein